MTQKRMVDACPIYEPIPRGLGGDQGLDIGNYFDAQTRNAGGDAAVWNQWSQRVSFDPSPLGPSSEVPQFHRDMLLRPDIS